MYYHPRDGAAAARSAPHAAVQQDTASTTLSRSNQPSNMSSEPGTQLPICSTEGAPASVGMAAAVSKSPELLIRVHHINRWICNQSTQSIQSIRPPLVNAGAWPLRLPPAAPYHAPQLPAPPGGAAARWESLLCPASPCAESGVRRAWPSNKHSGRLGRVMLKTGLQFMRHKASMACVNACRAAGIPSHFLPLPSPSPTAQPSPHLRRQPANAAQQLAHVLAAACCPATQQRCGKAPGS